MHLPSHMSAFRGLPKVEASLRWNAVLAGVEDTTTVARLYKGGYWSVARSIVQEATFPLDAYVASAGLGLKSFRERVPAYAATFNPGSDDSIPGSETAEGRRDWWCAIGGSASLRALALGTNRRIVVALPGEYLKVALPDLLFLQEELGARAIAVFTTDSVVIDAMGASAVPLDARMSRILGGAVGHVTVRALEHVLQQSRAPEDLTPGRARALLEEVRKAAPKELFPKRKRQTEDQVADWIRKARTGDHPPTSASAALRRFRDEGFAFEQKRFGRLFRSLLQEASR